MACLKIIKCNLLGMLGFRFHSLHQMLNLAQQKLTFLEEFALHHLYKNYEDEEVDKVKKSELIQLYSFQKETGRLEELME